jgi:hypothetical protein
MRRPFGGTPEAVVIGSDGRLRPGAQGTAYRVSDRVQITDLTDPDGVSYIGGVIAANAVGLADFFGPDDGTDQLIINFADGDPAYDVLLNARDFNSRIAVLEGASASTWNPAGGNTSHLTSTTDQLLRVDIDTYDSSSPDRLAFYFQGEPTGRFNEQGQVRSNAGFPDSVALRVKQARSALGAQTANLTEWTQFTTANILAWVDAVGNGRFPNFPARMSAASDFPSSPIEGEWFIHTGGPGLYLRSSGSWLLIAGTAAPAPGGGTPPDFIASTKGTVNANALTITLPTGVPSDGVFLLGLASAGTADPTTVPAGWSLVDQYIKSGGSSNLAVYAAPGNVAALSFAWGGATKRSWVCGGYGAGLVDAHLDNPSASGSETVHTAPSVVASYAARVVRFCLDKSSGTTSASWDAGSGVTQRNVQYGTGTGSCCVLLGDSLQGTDGATGAATATFDVGQDNAAGFTVALVGP